MVGGHNRAFIGDVHRKAISLDGRAVLAAGCFSTNPKANRETGETWRLDPNRVYPIKFSEPNLVNVNDNQTGVGMSAFGRTRYPSSR